VSILRRLAPLVYSACALAVLLAGAARADYTDDARTARGVAIGSPRAPLGECLQRLSQVTEVSLSAAPSLLQEPLVGYVPRRPLRETMQALEELYDGVWTVLPGSPPKYRLDLDPVRVKAAAVAHSAAFKEYRKVADEAAAEAARNLKNGGKLPDGRSDVQQVQLFSLLLWSHVPPADRDRVLNGQTVTISIPAAEAEPIHQLILSIAKKRDAKLIAPMLASFDLDDKTDLGIPAIRARATGLREDSVVGAIWTIDFLKQAGVPKPPEAPEGDPVLPEMIGDNGRFNGERDEVLVKLAQEAGVPILSRHRVQGGSISTVSAGGRKLTDVMSALGSSINALHRPNARGYQLFRSRTEAIDRSGLPPATVVENYLRNRPELGQPVPFTALVPLTPLTPLQLQVLGRSNVAGAEAAIAEEIFSLLRFYQALTPPQRKALFSEEGLDVGSLTHPQLHAILDEKAKRGGLDIHDHLQQLKGLRLRFKEELDKEESSLLLQALRDGTVVSSSTQELPKVEKEEEIQVSR
jgi:hypothetical protein